MDGHFSGILLQCIGTPKIKWTVLFTCFIHSEERDLFDRSPTVAAFDSFYRSVAVAVASPWTCSSARYLCCSTAHTSLRASGTCWLPPLHLYSEVPCSNLGLVTDPPEWGFCTYPQNPKRMPGLQPDSRSSGQKLPHFYGSEGSITVQLATGTYPEPFESSPQPQSFFVFILILYF
jgi:hypothetical protein